MNINNLKSQENGLAKTLKYVREASVSGANRFVVRDFVKEANIGNLITEAGKEDIKSNFVKYFLDKVEENVRNARVLVYDLVEDSQDCLIMAQMHGRFKINLVHYLKLLKRQRDGRKGVLLTDGGINIAYIKGTNEALWSISADWVGDYWNLEANPVDCHLPWPVGVRVLSLGLSLG